MTRRDAIGLLGVGAGVGFASRLGLLAEEQGRPVPVSFSDDRDLAALTRIAKESGVHEDCVTSGFHKGSLRPIPHDSDACFQKRRSAL